MARKDMNRRFAQNVERERELLGLTQKQMAAKLELSLSAYKRMVDGETSKIDLYTAFRLYQLTGKLSYEFANASDPLLDLKRKISGLSPSQVSYIDSMIDFEKAFGRQHADHEDYVTVYVPTGNMEDGMVYDSSNVEKMNIAAWRRRYGSQISCGIRVTSNHLHPVYLKGDTLLISRRAMRDGDTGAFINCENGRAYLRKYYQTDPCRLEPVNGCGETFFVDPNDPEDMDRWIKFGVVIARVR